MRSFRGAWVLALSLVSGCLFSVNDNGDGPSGGAGPTVGFDTALTSVDETIGELSIPVYLSAPPTELTTVQLSFGGTAAAGEDYHGGGGTLVFLPGVDFADLYIDIVADDLPEVAETIELSLSLPINARLGTSHHTIEIRENLLPRVTFPSALHGANEAMTATALEIDVMPASPVPITVGYTLGGTADSNDYTLQPGTLTIPAGVTTFMLPLGQLDDTIDEEDYETIEVTLVDPVNAIIGEFPAITHRIADDDATPRPTFVTSDVTIMEGDSGMQVVTAEVQLEKASARALQVPFGLTGLPQFSTATAGSDYMIMTASPLVFPAGETSQTITIAFYGDTEPEGQEQIVLYMSSGNDAYFGVVIENDECFGTGAYTVCPNTAPLGSITLQDSDFSTSSLMCASAQPRGWIAAGQPQACFIIATDITVDNFRAVGNYPLVLVATNSITVNGLLDVGAHLGGAIGAGSRVGGCAAFGGMPGTMAGGAGGSFMTAGGNGGSHNGPSGVGGIAAPALASPPAVLRGGCEGQHGSSGGNYGQGGGGLYLVAGSSITLASGATLNASGAPGEGGYFINDAGNGAGSGGMIVLYAPTLAANGARLLANGGGGGEGDDNGLIDGTYGTDGGEVDYASPLSPAPGGTGTGGGDGGRGACEGFDAGAGAGASSASSAGGGGGGLGFILVSQPMTGALASPTPVTL